MIQDGSFLMMWSIDAEWIIFNVWSCDNGWVIFNGVISWYEVDPFTGMTVRMRDKFCFQYLSSVSCTWYSCVIKCTVPSLTGRPSLLLRTKVFTSETQRLGRCEPLWVNSPICWLRTKSSMKNICRKLWKKCSGMWLTFPIEWLDICDLPF